MEIVVCIKRVPDVSEVDVEIASDGTSIAGGDLSFGINEWDNFAVEEAIRLREEHGGTVTVVTIGPQEAEDELRRALAMGADQALRIHHPDLDVLDAFATARVLRAVLASRPFDLILTGAVASDTGSGQVGGMLAEMLDVPQVALATAIRVEGTVATVQHEVEGGAERVVEVDLPAVVSVQTGLNEPRYVSVRGIRRVSGAEIPVVELAGPDLESVDAGGVRVRVAELRSPPTGKEAEILQGSAEEVVAVLVDRLRENGGL